MMTSTEVDLLDVFNDTEDTSDFLGFDSDTSSSLEINSSNQSDVSSSVESSDDSGSDSETEYADIARKQKQQMNKKKQILNKLMEELNEDPLFCKMKTSTPERRKTLARSNRVFSNFNYRFDRPVTRSRNSSLEGGSIPVHQQLTVKMFAQKRKFTRNDNHDDNHPKRHRSSQAAPHIILPVEDVTAHMLSNISQHSAGKNYDPCNGTSCHQCRQKTTDTKSCCRYEKCVGIRGQFCGPCLLNRYGESVHEALLDPDWKCPVCRGFCNCSICRNRKGKCPTGILIGLARQSGHNNVKDYLKKLENSDVEE